MSRILQAACVGGIVTSNGVPVVEASVLSEGVGPSQGVLFLDEADATYLPSSAGDIKTALDSITSALSAIVNGLTAISASMAGPATAPPPTLPAIMVQITGYATALTALKATLK